MQGLVSDCVALARVEGLEGHAQAAECRLQFTVPPQDETKTETDHKRQKI